MCAGRAFRVPDALRRLLKRCASSPIAPLTAASVAAVGVAILLNNRGRSDRREASLIDKLRSVLTRLTAASREERIPLEHRAVSLLFLRDWHSGIEKELGADEAKKVNSFHIVGERSVETDDWFAGSPEEKLPSTKSPPWSIRFLTGGTGVCLVETLLLAAEVTGDRSFTHDANGRPYFGSTTHFLSHTWTSSFSTMLAAVAQQKPPKDAYFWVDMLCLAQNDFVSGAKANKKEDLERMDEGWPIRTSGATWMLAEPWRKPAAFGRVWCLNECFLTVQCEKKFELIMPPTEARDFEKSLAEDFYSLAKVVSEIDMQNATATKEKDKTRIFEAVRQSGIGFVKVNQIVIGQLREWFAKTGRAALDRLPSEAREVSPLINELALLLRDQAKYDEARGLLEEALDARTKMFGSKHEIVATVLNNLAALLRDQGKLKEAEPLFRRAIEIGKVTLGENHPGLATRLNNLGLLLYDQVDYLGFKWHRDSTLGKLEEAESLFRRAIEIGKVTRGENHPDLARWLNNRAGLMYDQGKLEEAEPLFRRAIKIGKVTLGENHPDLAKWRNNLGGLLEHQGKYDEAEPLYRRAIEIGKVTLGENHPGLATWLNNLGGLLHKKGKLNEAEALYRRALKIDEEALGPSHPMVATDLNNLAVFMSNQGKHVEALKLRTRCLQIERQTLGEEHPQYAASLNNLAMLLINQGKLEEAGPLFRRAIEIGKVTLGKNHPVLAAWLNNLGLLLYNQVDDLGSKWQRDSTQDKLEEAEPLFRRAIEIGKVARGENHPDLATWLNNLAVLLHKQGKLEEAEPLFRRAIEIGKVTLGENHRGLAARLNNLGLLLYNQVDYLGSKWQRDSTQGKLEEAEPLFRRAIEIGKVTLGENHPDLATWIKNLSGLLIKQGKFAEAFPLAQRAASIFEKTLGSGHSSTQELAVVLPQLELSLLAKAQQQAGGHPKQKDLEVGTGDSADVDNAADPTAQHPMALAAASQHDYAPMDAESAIADATAANVQQPMALLADSGIDGIEDSATADAEDDADQKGDS
ncbi:hypothetical protein CTAYLR_009932 [Chrysophaeum taylorii]|uniref:Kinesin light chain n=1 Tax=Chrysophaeum taylorii TaxID=2483200 RepID=A0AAD7U6D8_9STRA|nr:hypothetical protein CTAYLR_009932 [Chrysophaeum taylorii]